MSLCALGLSEAAADIREGRITSVELVDRLPRAHRRGRRRGAGLGVSRPRPRAARRRRRSTMHRARRQGRWARCTACRSASRTSSTPATCRPNSARRCGPAARRARDAAAVARLRAAGAVIMGKTVTTEYAYFHPGKTRNPHDRERTPGRLVERLGGGGRGRHGAGRDRLADQRLGDPPGGVLRRGRLQADARPHPAHRRADAVAHARPCRRVRAHGRGRGAAGRGAGRLRRGGSRHAADGAAAASRRWRRASRRCRRASPSCARRPGSRPSR